jgi:hypothetical protein
MAQYEEVRGNRRKPFNPWSAGLTLDVSHVDIPNKDSQCDSLLPHVSCMISYAGLLNQGLLRPELVCMTLLWYRG